MLVFVKRFPWLLVSFLVRSFSYISLAGSVQWGVSLTHLMLCLFLRSFSYRPHDMFIREEFLLHSSWCLFVRSFSYTPDAMFIRGEFLLHSWCYFSWGVSLTILMLVFVRSFSYTPLLALVRFSYTPGASFSEEFTWSFHASFREEFLLHSSR